MVAPHTSSILHIVLYPGEGCGGLPSHSLSVSGSEGLVEREERRRGREEQSRGRHEQVGAGTTEGVVAGARTWAGAREGARAGQTF